MKKRENYGKFYASLLVCLSCLLFGCGKADLLSNISEDQANEVLSTLQQANLPATKKPGLESTWTVAINDTSNFSRAVELLKAKGFPKTEYNNMGKIFQKTGMVSSPLEERARLMYAMAESISETLSKIPGVLTARVHVVLPENDPYAENSIVASAAVFISYRSEFSLDESVREIKYLVTNSIQGLSYDKVSVALFPVTFTNDAQRSNQSNLTSVLGVAVDQASAGKLWILISVMGLLLVLAISTAGFFGYMFVRKNNGDDSNRSQANTPVVVQEPPALSEKRTEEDEEDISEDDDTPISSVK
jgi:type III secretion protein J